MSLWYLLPHDARVCVLESKAKFNESCLNCMLKCCLSPDGSSIALSVIHVHIGSIRLYTTLWSEHSLALQFGVHRLQQWRLDPLVCIKCAKHASAAQCNTSLLLLLFPGIWPQISSLSCQCSVLTKCKYYKQKLIVVLWCHALSTHWSWRSAIT